MNLNLLKLPVAVIQNFATMVTTRQTSPLSRMGSVSSTNFDGAHPKGIDWIIERLAARFSFIVIYIVQLNYRDREHVKKGVT